MVYKIVSIYMSLTILLPKYHGDDISSIPTIGLSHKKNRVLEKTVNKKNFTLDKEKKKTPKMKCKKNSKTFATTQQKKKS